MILSGWRGFGHIVVSAKGSLRKSKQTGLNTTVRVKGLGCCVNSLSHREVYG